MSEPLLSVTGLSCEVNGRTLFENLDCLVQPGELLQVDGPNGSGKSTLLRCFAGLKQNYEGSVSRNEEDCAYLGHKTGLNPVLTVTENLLFFATLSASHIVSDLNTTIERLDLSRFRHHKVASLSAGLKQRCAISRLLVQAKTLWLLDEPRTSLDSDSGELLTRLLNDHLDAGGAIVLVSHTALDLDVSQTLVLEN